jgi:ATP-dependent exoDNAse (exonuclease V) alpha subunit
VESIVISGSNADRHRINDRIRELLVEKGDIMQGQTFRTFTSVGVSGSARSLADSYKEGQVLFLQEDVQGLKKGTQATITGVDAQRNELRVQYWNKEHGAYERDSIPVIYHGSKIRAFAIEEKNFSAGDEVLFLKNDKKIGVKNGQMGRIIAIDEEGTAKIRIGKEKRSALAGKVIDASVYVECNLSNTGARGYNFIDHGYAVTAHKSQGATVEKAIVYGDSTGMQTSTNDFYVCLTRAQYGVSVYTDSIERMRESASHEQRKESTLDTLSMDTFVEQTRRKYQEPTSLMLSEQAHKEKEQGEEIERRRRAAEILKESAKAIEEFEKRRPKSPEATHPEKSKEPEKVQKKPQPEKNKNSQGIELDL